MIAARDTRYLLINISKLQKKVGDPKGAQETLKKVPETILDLEKLLKIAVLNLDSKNE